MQTKCFARARSGRFALCFATLNLGMLTAAAAFASQQAPALKSPSGIVTDETGRRVAVPADVRRIVSLAPNLTETIYALGAQERLVGDTAYCNYPDAARSKPRVGAPINPSLEAILALKPDLILATTAINRRETVTALERLGLTVYATDPHTVEGLLAGIRRLAELIGAGAEGQALVGQLQERLDVLHAKLAARAPRRVLFIVWEDPLISIGQSTFIADALRWAGAESVVRTTRNWPKLSLEEVVRYQPEYLVLARDHDDAAASTLAELRARPAWRELDAVRQGRIAIVSDAVDRPAPRLVDAIEELARQLHPDAFREEQQHRKEKLERGPEASAGPISLFLNSIFFRTRPRPDRCAKN